MLFHNATIQYENDNTHISKLMFHKSENVFFCLARGYTFLKKYKYFKLILRNLFLNKYLKNGDKYTSIIFHEGNITIVDQLIIKLFSLNMQIKFINICSLFILPKNLTWTNDSIYGLGYSLMCRFNYYQVWDLIRNFRTAIRVDDDVLVLNLRDLKSNEVYLCSDLYPETHDQTNRSFLYYLQANGNSRFYDHKFPPNCFYVTNIKFWLGKSVTTFLHNVSNSKLSLEHRWGDTVVMGVCLKKFGGKNGISVDPDISYIHLSHDLLISKGYKSNISKNRLFRYYQIFKLFMSR